MSKKDYTKFANKTEKVDEKHEVVIENTIEKEAPKVEQRVEQKVEPKVEQKVDRKIGTVIDCSSLNVRKEPSKYADILCTIQASEKVEIDESKSTNDFYKIFNSAGVEGYCMKNYISVDR